MNAIKARSLANGIDTLIYLGKGGNLDHHRLIHYLERQLGFFLEWEELDGHPGWVMACRAT